MLCKQHIVDALDRLAQPENDGMYLVQQVIIHVDLQTLALLELLDVISSLLRCFIRIAILKLK